MPRRNAQRATSSPEAAPPPTGAKPQWRLYALVFAVAVGCYVNSLNGELLFDDLPAIVENRMVRDGAVADIVRTPSWAHWVGIGYAGYRPVTTLSFALNHRLHGLAPFGYHLVNVILHAVVCVLLLVVLTRITAQRDLAVLAAMLFAAHPVHTEAVASVVGRAELLAAFFAVTAWLLAAEARRRPQRAIALGISAGLVLAAGVFSKENAATVIGVVIAADVVYRGERESMSAELRRGVPVYLMLALGAGAALAIRTFVAREMLPAASSFDNVLAGAPCASRVLTTLAITGSYARLLVWPLRLSADYSFRQVEAVSSASTPGVALGLGVVLLAAGGIVWGWRRQRHLCFALACVAATFSIVAFNALAGIGATMAERFLYLPSIGFCLCVAVAIDAIKSGGRRGGPSRRSLAAFIVTVLVVLYAARTMARNRIWSDRLAFTEAMVADAPLSARSHRELGLAYSWQGRHDEAIAALRASLDISEHPAALYDLGNVSLRARRFDEAIAAYARALERKPDFAAAMTNLGNAYSGRGDERTAETWFRRGLAADPANVKLHTNLANALLRQGRPAEAVVEYEEAIRLDPRWPLARFNYGVLLSAQGRHADALEQLRQAAALAPESPEIADGLIAALEAAGMHEEARARRERSPRE
jgi:tetratricopeptide (TPR) repeat protein